MFLFHLWYKLLEIKLKRLFKIRKRKWDWLDHFTLWMVLSCCQLLISIWSKYCIREMVQFNSYSFWLKDQVSLYECYYSFFKCRYWVILQKYCLLEHFTQSCFVKVTEPTKLHLFLMVLCVTWASGYIASWLVKVLLQRSCTIKVSVRDTSMFSSSIPR